MKTILVKALTPLLIACLLINLLALTGSAAEPSSSKPADGFALSVEAEGSSLVISWEPVEGANRYYVFRCEARYGTYKRIVKTSKTTYANRDRKDNKVYFYIVKAYVVKDGKIVETLAKSAAEPGVVMTLSPKKPQASPKSNAVTLSWAKLSGASGYDIYRSTDGENYQLAASRTGVSWTDTAVKSGATYHYKLLPWVENSGWRFDGDYSPKISVEVPLPEGTPVSATVLDTERENWAYFLINKENYLPAGYVDTIELGLAIGGYYADVRIIPSVNAMITAAASEGLQLSIISAYRSLERQEKNYAYNIDRLQSEYGYSLEAAVRETGVAIAPPGASEHNAGIAVDLVNLAWYEANPGLNSSFDQTAEFKWLSENAHKYGFILRYPKGKTDVTGYIYEPWHYRYVGEGLAEEIWRSGLCLEEFVLLN